MAGAGGCGFPGGDDDLRGPAGNGPERGDVSARPWPWTAAGGGADGALSPGAGGVPGGGICRGLFRRPGQM